MHIKISRMRKQFKDAIGPVYKTITFRSWLAEVTSAESLLVIHEKEQPLAKRVGTLLSSDRV